MAPTFCRRRETPGTRGTPVPAGSFSWLRSSSAPRESLRRAGRRGGWNTAVCRSPPTTVGFVASGSARGTWEFHVVRGDVRVPGGGGARGACRPPADVGRRRRWPVTDRRRQFRASGHHIWISDAWNVAQPGSGGGVSLGSTSDPSAGVDALQCRFGGAYVTGATAVSSDCIRCETPTSDAAVDRALATDVSINAGEDYAGAQTYFEPLAEAFVLGLEPRAGTCGGGTVVNVYGAGFTVDEPVWCKFGTTGPIPAEYAGGEWCGHRAESPAKATMHVPLEVSRGTRST